MAMAMTPIYRYKYPRKYLIGAHIKSIGQKYLVIAKLLKKE